MLTALAVGIVAGSTTLLVNRLNVAVTDLGTIAVPDLLNSRQIIQRLLENWSKLLLIQQTGSKEKRLQLISEINNNSIDSQIGDLERTLTSSEQRSNFMKLISARKRFIHLREQYFDLVAVSDTAAASDFLTRELIPGFAVYQNSAEALCDSTSMLGKAKAERVVRLSRTVVAGAGVLAVLVFGAGFFLGFYSLFRGLAWVNVIASPRLPMPDPTKATNR